VSLDFEIGNTQMTIAPPFRGGAIARFPVRRIQRVAGKVLVVSGGNDEAAAFGTLTLTVDGQTVESPLGGAGEFYFENIAPGRHAAVVTYAQSTCTFTIEIPVVDGQLVGLGTLRCTDATQR
jgi:outer membrane usher protein